MPKFAAEWLETDGHGGFASGTVGGERTRRYHALLLPATTPPTGRIVLVNGIEAWIECGGVRTFLTTQRYQGDVVYPDSASRIIGFEHDRWPRWTFQLEDGGRVTQDILIAGRQTLLRWTYAGARPGRLFVRPLISGRDYHALHHENADLDFTAAIAAGAVTWRPYAGLPAITAQGNFVYHHAPDWYRSFLYTAERERGLDGVEDLAAPGLLEWDLAAGPALLAFGTEPGPPPADAFTAECQRRAGSAPIDRAADQYLARRQNGLTIIAGYPWFTDWGRDTFISIRGLVSARGRDAQAEQILTEWAGSISQGMLPNRFPDAGDAPEYNAVDASLWFVIAAAGFPSLQGAIEAILDGYASGTRYDIGADRDGLLRAGAPEVALTWMDARVDGRAVTPRRGKPVEVQALWINALHVAAAWSPRWAALERRAHAAFLARFPDPATAGLYDVVDADFVAGAIDASVRPNQIFAAGGLPLNLLDHTATAGVLALMETRLLTPLGLRTLAPGEPGYSPRYLGGSEQRDAAYHQGTVWPWLMGPFVEAWLRHRGSTPAARDEARTRFLAPLLAALEQSGLGHLPEIADAEPPHTPRGCPFQAWSMAALLQIQHLVDKSGP